MFTHISKYYFSIIDRIHTCLWNKCSDTCIDFKVLMFHHVTDKNIAEMPTSCVCRIDKFIEIINKYRSENVRFITPYDLLEKKISKGVLITFDDITDDVYLSAFPILLKYNIPFTLFVATGLIDIPPYITTDHLLEMANSPLCTVASHSISHPNLRQCKNLKLEIYESKRILEQLLNKPIDFFAYPYGKHSSVSRQVREFVKRSGYMAAFGTINAPINKRSIKAHFYFPRVIE